jgi:L-asparaginase II
MTAELPVLVEIVRGMTVESRHRGSLVAVDSSGATVAALGDPETMIFPRSAIKPIQSALVMAETGAAQAFDVGEPELALACSSHSAESVHVEAVRAWLTRLGYQPANLECGAQDPSDIDSLHDLYRAQGRAGPEHNNCSGKHTGFLTICRHLGVEPAGYLEPDHPAQAAVCRAMADMCDVDLARADLAIDGCGVPSIAMPLEKLAFGMARLADPDDLAPARADACRAIVRAMAAHPVMVAGTKRFGTALLKAGRGRFVSKTGAEGVYCAAWPEKKLGIAVKIEDGAGRAAEIVIAHVLRKLGALDDQGWAALGGRHSPAIRNWTGTEVGDMRPSEEFADMRLG